MKKQYSKQPNTKAVHNDRRDSPDIREKNRRSGRFRPGQSGNPATQFKPGQSGNPAGRPKTSLTADLRKVLGTVVPDDPQGRTYNELIAHQICERAAKGDVRATTLVWERLEGKATQPIEVNSDAKREWWLNMVEDISRKHGKPREKVIQDIINREPEAAELLN
jgi:Family of unknown function (DUF5681)